MTVVKLLCSDSTWVFQTTSCIKHQWKQSSVIQQVVNEAVINSDQELLCNPVWVTLEQDLTCTGRAEHALQVQWWLGRASTDSDWCFLLPSLACQRHQSDRCTHCQPSQPAPTHIQPTFWQLYLKNDTDIAHYNFNAHQRILVIIGRDVAETAY